MMTTITISRQEWRWLLIWSFLIVLITSLPALLAWSRTPADMVYTGQVLSPADGNTYLNKIKQGAAGQWLFSIGYTSEPHEPIFLHPYYITLGHLARLVNLPLNVTFQLFRALNSWLLLITVYWFIAIFWPEPAKRQLTFFFVALSAGLGWLFIFFDVATTDLKVPESITFLTMLVNPHFPLATAFVILSLAGGMLALHRRSWVYATLCGLSQTVLLFLHPYDIVITGATLAAYFALGLWRHWWSWPTVGYLSLSGLICLPAFWHNLKLYTLTGVWQLWQTQAPPPTPLLITFILGYGFLLILAAIGGYAIFRQDGLASSSPAQILILWMVGVFIIMFAPIPPLEAIQVRFSEGLHIPIAILAAHGLWVFLARKRGQIALQTKVWLPILIFLSLSNWLTLSSAIWRVSTPEAPWFYTQDEVAVMRWLDAHSQPDDIVLTLNWTGNYLPAQANIHVYVGHLYETIDYQKKVERSEAFFANHLSEAEARAFLRNNRIDWLFIGQQEAATPFQPETKPYLTQAFAQGDSAVYRVNLP